MAFWGRGFLIRVGQTLWFIQWKSISWKSLLLDVILRKDKHDQGMISIDTIMESGSLKVDQMKGSKLLMHSQTVISVFNITLKVCMN